MLHFILGHFVPVEESKESKSTLSKVFEKWCHLFFQVLIRVRHCRPSALKRLRLPGHRPSGGASASTAITVLPVENDQKRHDDIEILRIDPWCSFFYNQWIRRYNPQVDSKFGLLVGLLIDIYTLLLFKIDQPYRLVFWGHWQCHLCAIVPQGCNVVSSLFSDLGRFLCFVLVVSVSMKVDNSSDVLYDWEVYNQADTFSSQHFLKRIGKRLGQTLAKLLFFYMFETTSCKGSMTWRSLQVQRKGTFKLGLFLRDPEFSWSMNSWYQLGIEMDLHCIQMCKEFEPFEAEFWDVCFQAAFWPCWGLEASCSEVVKPQKHRQLIEM